MAVSKVILNGETLIDTTQKTVTAGSMLSGTTALKNDGTDITGNIVSKSSTDLTVSGATVTVPAGYYASNASASVSSGTEGTPSAAKGSVSNHSVSVTPSVTNSAGYISGSTHTGTAVSVSASELVSGTLEISGNGEGIDVTNYAAVDVDVEPNIESLTVTPTESQQVFDGATSVVAYTIQNGLYMTNVQGDFGTAMVYYFGDFHPESGKTYTINGEGYVYSDSSTTLTFSGTMSYDGSSGSLPFSPVGYPVGENKNIPSWIGIIAIGSGTALKVNGPYNGWSSSNRRFIVTSPITFSETGQVDGYLPVTVNAVSSSYVGSSITRRDSTDLSASGATVSVPAGYYENAASASVGNGSVTAPSTIIGSGASVTTGTNTLTLSKTVSVTPSVTTAGYITSGTAGNSDVSLSASVTTKAAATYYPSASDQTITASQYLTGAQTIKGVTTSNITAGNIKSGVTVKVGDSVDDDRVLSVTGTFDPAPSIESLTVTPTASQQVFGGNEQTLIGQCYISDEDSPDTESVNLSAFSVGDTCSIRGTLYCSYNGSSNHEDSADTDFTWTGSTYTYSTGNGYYTLAVSASSIVITNNSGNGTMYATGDHYLKVYKTVSIDGYLPVTVNAMPSGSATTPATTITANPSISVSSSGLITSSVSGSASITPTVSAGYVASGTSGTVSVSGSNTEQLTTQAAQTIYPSTSDQTIASGKYLTGAQTVKGVLLTNLTADNIAEGVTVKVGDSVDDDRIISVTGTHSGGGAVTSLTVKSTNTQQVFEDPAVPTTQIQSFSWTSSGQKSFTDALTVGETYYCIVQASYDDFTYYTYYDGTFVCSSSEVQLTSYVYITNTYVRMTSDQYDRVIVTVYESAIGAYNPVTVEPFPLTSKTVTPSEYTQYVLPDTELCVFEKKDTASAHTAGTAAGYGTLYFTPTTELTRNQTYRFIGHCDVIDSSNQVLDSYDIDVSAAWSSTSISLVQDDDADAYYKYIRISRNSTTGINCGAYYNKTATYGFNLHVSVYEEAQYDGLSMVTVEPVPSSFVPQSVLKSYIERSSTFTTIDWPDGLQYIGNYAFASCNYFNPTSLPSGITSIGSYAFYGDQYLTLTSLPDTVTAINNYAFYGCTGLALTSLPSSLRIISGYAFYNCRSMTVSSLPSSLTNLGTYAFYGCSGITVSSIPSGITSVQQNAFANCTSITAMTIPSSCTVIDAYAFSGCTSLATVSLPNTLTSIKSSAFSNCSSLPTISLPSTVTEIGTYSFKSCVSLENISCDGVITTLGNYAFNGNTDYLMGLVSARFPYATVSSIGTVFGSTTVAYACQELELVDLGSIASIAANAFCNCYSLSTVVLRKSDAICTLANVSAFLNTPLRGYNSLTGTVYVPSALKSAYETATNWKTMVAGGTLEFKAIEGSIYEL